MKNEKATKRTASIARKINFSWWVQTLWGYICLDIFLIAAVIISFGSWYTKQLSDKISIRSWKFSIANGMNHLLLVIKDTQGERHVFEYDQVFQYAMIPFMMIAVVQIISLIARLFDTRNIRRKLKPLNDLAIKAEQVSQMTFDSSQMVSLEQAIERISPEADEFNIYTGDKELHSIEIALNNLLRGMKKSLRKPLKQLRMSLNR